MYLYLKDTANKYTFKLKTSSNSNDEGNENEAENKNDEANAEDPAAEVKNENDDETATEKNELVEADKAADDEDAKNDPKSSKKKVDDKDKRSAKKFVRLLCVHCRIECVTFKVKFLPTRSWNGKIKYNKNIYRITIIICTVVHINQYWDDLVYDKRPNWHE